MTGGKTGRRLVDEDLADELHRAAALVDVDQDPALILARVDPAAVAAAARTLDADDLAAMALIGHVAGHVILDELAPGCGSLLIPAAAAAVLAETPGYTSQQQIRPGYDHHDFRLAGYVRPGGSLELRLTWHGTETLWTGILRAPGPGNQHTTEGSKR